MKLNACYTVAGLAIAALGNPANASTLPIVTEAERTPVTLVASSMPCLNLGKMFEHVDAAGQIVSSPFYVPKGKTFVVTDAAWSIWARPSQDDFTTSDEVHFELYAHLADEMMFLATSLPSERVGRNSASGKHSFSQGPAFVEATYFCGVGNALVYNGSWGAKLGDRTVVHGFLIDAQN